MGRAVALRAMPYRGLLCTVILTCLMPIKLFPLPYDFNPFYFTQFTPLQKYIPKYPLADGRSYWPNGTPQCGYSHQERILAAAHMYESPSYICSFCLQRQHSYVFIAAAAYLRSLDSTEPHTPAPITDNPERPQLDLPSVDSAAGSGRTPHDTQKPRNVPVNNPSVSRPYRPTCNPVDY